MLTPVDEIKQRLDIVDVVQQYVKLLRAGANLKAACPFHAEKTPSFFVSPERQTWHCFGCNKGGDMFSFIQEIEGVEFKEALRILAQRAGVVLKAPPQGYEFQKPEQKTNIAEQNEWATQFFETQLQKSTMGNAARVYLASRGVSLDTIKKFRIGFMPNTQDALVQFLRTKGFSSEEVQIAGFATSSLKDRFRGRIMFPISDRSGRVLGFSGRIFGREEEEYDPKYLNTAQTPLFDKSRVLFGLSHAVQAIRKAGVVVLVEGQMDCVMSHQAGVENVVATSGTALTPFHLRILKRIADTLVVAFDADTAGEHAARRGVELALEAGMMVKVVPLPPEKDPADIAYRDPKEWQELVADPKHIIQFFLERAIAHYGQDSPDAKRLVAHEVLPLVAFVANKVEQSHWVSELSRALNIREDALWEEMTRMPSKPSSELPKESLPQESPDLSRRTRIERHLLSAVYLEPQELPENFLDLFIDPSHKRIAEVFVVRQDLEQIDDELRALLEPIMFFAEELSHGGADIGSEKSFCFRELAGMSHRERLEGLAQELASAERMGNQIRVQELSALVDEHSRKLGESFVQ